MYPPGLEPDLPAQGAADLHLDAVVIEEGLFLFVEFDGGFQLGHEGVAEFQDLVVFLLGIDDHPVYILGEEVPDRPQADVQVLMNQAGNRAARLPLLDAAPHLHEKVQVLAEFGFSLSFRGRAHDQPARRGLNVLDNFPESLSFGLVFDPPGDPDMVDHGHENQVTAGKGDVGSDPGAFGSQGLLGYLDENFLPLV